MIRYAITNGLSPVAGLAAQNLDFVQLRNQATPVGNLLVQARALVTSLPSPGKVLINGRVDVALAAGAAGVHLTARAEELRPDQVRVIYSSAGKAAPVISVSCHTFAEVECARDAQVDLILFGPVFEKRVGDELVREGIGLDALQQACLLGGAVPVLALGGVTEATAPLCLQAGAAGIAGIRLFQEI